MALSDCEKCWDTPCTCGYSYSRRPLAYLVQMRDLFQRLIDERPKEGGSNPEANPFKGGT